MSLSPDAPSLFSPRAIACGLLYFLCAACAVQATDFSHALPSADPVAPLSVGMASNPVGKARLQGEHEDLFVQVSGFSQTYGIYLLNRIGTDADGAPIFTRDKQVTLNGEPFTKSDNGYVLQSPDGAVYGFWTKKKAMLITRYDAQTADFKTVNTVVKSPVSGRFCVYPQKDGGLRFFYIRSFGEPYRNKDDNNRSPDFRPFDGGLIWTGGIPYGYVVSAVLPGLEAKAFGPETQVSPSKQEAVLGATGIDILKDPSGKPLLMLGGRVGILSLFAIGENGQLSDRRFVRGQYGVILRHPSINISPITYENGLVAGGESAVYFYALSDADNPKGPTATAPVYVRERGAPLYAGSLPVVKAYDWNANGKTDMVVGNSQGEILFFENVGEPGAPRFKQAVPVQANGEPIHVQGGYWGVQGPGESRWGYVGPNIYDWDGNGLPDILTNDATSRHGVYFNEGTLPQPKLGPQRLLYCDGMELHGTWRIRPAVGKLGDKTAYIALDDDDQLHLYWQIDARNLSDGGKLLLDDGTPIQANFIYAGGTGRAKLILADIDGDGVQDLLIGTPRHGSFPNPKTGLPKSRAIPGEPIKKDKSGKPTDPLPGASVLFLKNVGTNEAPTFAFPKMLRTRADAAQNKLTTFGQHECSADVADFGNGLKGIVVGEEEGRVLFFPFTDIIWD